MISNGSDYRTTDQDTDSLVSSAQKKGKQLLHELQTRPEG